MKRIFLIVTLVLIFFHGSLFAEETGMGDTAEESGKINSSLTLSGGFRFIDLSGSAQVGEYEYLHNSIVLGVETQLIMLPHRMHIDLNVNNGKDYAGDLSYSYKDILSFRGLNTTLYHNLDNITLIDLDPATASPRVDVRDAGEEYGIKTSLSSFFFRLKAPDFPLHGYVEEGLVEKDGTQQQRFMSGAAYFNEQVRASRSRDINWKTEDIVIGANSHLGPVEVDISHSEKRFRAGGDDILYDSYSAGGTRTAGVYPHNLIPELKGSTNTIRLHTSYTGRLVASATLSNTSRENSDSEAKADYVTGSGEVTWMPIEKLTFFFNYRYNDRDVDNPESVTITDGSDPSNKYTYSVKPSVSSVSNTFSGTARYRASKNLTLKAKFSYDNIRRKNAEEWDLPEKTSTSKASASADLKLRRNLNLKAGYTHKSTDNPSTNIEPDTSDEGEFSVSWMPVQKVNTFLSYKIKDGERDELHYIDTEAADKRNVNQNRILGSVTILPLKDLSLTASYFYLNDKTQQDIEYHNTAGTPNIDPYVPYKNTSHNYSIYAMYIPVERVHLNAGVSNTRSSGSFHVEDINLTQPVAIDSFSEMKTEKTVYSISGEYMFMQNSSLMIEYLHGKLDDILDNPNDDIEDGRGHRLILTFLKKW
ncbi:MAG: MtrB/PioB family outer membrane beta-barrel protein [Nitrospirae bacterium]|nr:MtrB/PioB family outer membrane beta-barrel protein [Nitrospirota bacterium]